MLLLECFLSPASSLKSLSLHLFSFQMDVSVSPQVAERIWSEIHFYVKMYPLLMITIKDQVQEMQYLRAESKDTVENYTVQ